MKKYSINRTYTMSARDKKIFDAMMTNIESFLLDCHMLAQRKNISDHTLTLEFSVKEHQGEEKNL